MKDSTNTAPDQEEAVVDRRTHRAHRQVFSSTTLPWPVSIRILVTCREVMLYHQQAVIYQPMTRILSHMAKSARTVFSYQPRHSYRYYSVLYARFSGDQFLPF